MTDARVDHVVSLRGRWWRGRRRIGARGVTIGRHLSCDLVLRSPAAPARAARVERRRDGTYAVALSPEIDLRLAGKRILQAKLADGDVLLVHGEEVRYLRAARARLVLVPLLGLLVAALVVLSVLYRTSDRYYRNLALAEFQKGNTQALEQYVEKGIISDPEKLLADQEVMSAADQLAPEIPAPPEVPQDTFEAEVDRVLRGFGVPDREPGPWPLSRIERWVKLYAGNRTFHLSAERAMARSTQVSDMMIRKLRASVMPEYLAFLAFAESHFDTDIESQAGAVGLWQFMPATAREWNLPDRTDPVRSTDAAIGYLTQLTTMLGADSILLAMAAYNCGEGNVRRCLRRSVVDPFTERTFWHLSRTGCLPEETQEYVPKILALAVIGTQPDKYGFPVPPGYQLHELKPKIADDKISPDPTPAQPAAMTEEPGVWTSNPFDASPPTAAGR